MATKTFNISFPAELADQIDAFAAKRYATRSDFLREAAIKAIRAEQELIALMAYGKEIGEKTGYRSEEEVATSFTEQRRKLEPWRVGIQRRS